MAEPESKWVDAVTKLIRLTQEGKLHWKSDEPPYLLAGNDENRRVFMVFKSEFKGRKLMVYEQYQKESPSSFLGYQLRKEVSDYYRHLFPEETAPRWLASVKLDIIDKMGNSLWSVPQTASLTDLLSAVQYQVSGARALLNDILSFVEPPETQEKKIK